MRDGTKCEQLILFRKQLAWHELPGETRDRTIDLVATLCVEIVTELPLSLNPNLYAVAEPEVLRT